MPIQIEEMVIRTKINSNDCGKNSGAGDNAEIIRASVERVLEILKNQKTP